MSDLQLLIEEARSRGLQIPGVTDRSSRGVSPTLSGIPVDKQGRVMVEPFQETARSIADRAKEIPALALGAAGAVAAPIVGPAIAATRLAPLVTTGAGRVLSGTGLGAAEGAARGALTGEGAGSGAVTGGLLGAAGASAGELLGGIINKGAKMFAAPFAREGIMRDTFQRLADIAPNVTGGAIKNDKDFFRLFVQGEGARNASKTFAGDLNEIMHASGNPGIVVPTLAQRLGAPPDTSIPLSTAFDEVQKLGEVAFRGGPSPAKQLAREAWRGITEEIRQGLSDINPKLMNAYDTARDQFRVGNALIQFFKSAPGLTENGRLNMNAVRDALESAKTVQVLYKKAPNAADALIDALSRGEGPLSGREVTGQLPRLRGTRAGSPASSFFQPGRFPETPGLHPFESPGQRAALDALGVGGLLSLGP